MKKTLFLTAAALGLFSLLAADFAYAKGWCGGGRSAAGQARITPSFSSPTFSSTGETVAGTDYFDSIQEVKEAMKRGHLSLLYLYDSRHGKKVKKFENVVFKNEDLGVAMKVFRRMKLDVSRDRVARDLYGQKVPRFITFNSKGRRSGDLFLKDYRTKSSLLMKTLAKASKGHGKLPLKTFVKKYRSFLNELDQFEGKKATFAQKKTRLKAASGSRNKLRKVEKEEALLRKSEQALLAREKKLLESVKAFTPEKRSRKLAAR